MKERSFFSELGVVGKGAATRRTHEYRGLLVNPSLVLKLYLLGEVKSNGRRVMPKESSEAFDFVSTQINSRQINPLSGLGFCIHSEGILNVCRWDQEYKDVVVPTIFIEENGIWNRKSVEEVGAFCSGEKVIYDLENAAWLRYLSSRRRHEDKARYLGLTYLPK